MLGRNVPACTAPLARVSPPIDTRDANPEHLPHGINAAALRDHDFGRRLHGVDDCAISALPSSDFADFDICSNRNMVHQRGMENDVPQRIRDWLQKSLDEGPFTQSSLARAMGISSSAVSRILKGDRQIGVQELKDALVFFGKADELHKLLQLDQLLTSEYVKIKTIEQAEKQFEYDKENLRKLSHSKRISSTGDFDATSKVRAYDGSKSIFSIPWSIIGKHSKDDNLRWMMVMDDAMEPTISRTDIVIFDVGTRLPTWGGLCIVEDGFGNAVPRRLDFENSVEQEDPMVTLLTDNPKFTPKTMRFSGVRLVGRCLGIYKILL